MRVFVFLLPILLSVLTGCADSLKFQRADKVDAALVSLANKAIEEDQKTARTALGCGDCDENGKTKTLQEQEDRSSNLDAGQDSVLVDNLLNEAASLGLIPPRKNNQDRAIKISLFSGPIVNSAIQINTGAASKQSGGYGSNDKNSLAALARAAVNKIGAPVKTDMDTSIDAGLKVLNTIAWPVAAGWIADSAFGAAGNRSYIQESTDSGNTGSNSPGRTEDNSDNSINIPTIEAPAEGDIKE